MPRSIANTRAAGAGSAVVTPRSARAECQRVIGRVNTACGNASLGARALEAQKVANAMSGWLNQLAIGGSEYASYTTPSSASGVGLTEAPRGALGHWTSISTAKLSPTGGPSVANYQVITPTCWNASPKDSNGLKGAMEQALIGTRVSDATQPIEVLRVVHSFDPCLSCAVHVMRPNGQPVVVRTPAANGRSHHHRRCHAGGPRTRNRVSGAIRGLCSTRMHRVAARVRPFTDDVPRGQERPPGCDRDRHRA